MSYKKLNKNELKELYKTLESVFVGAEQQSELVRVVNKYFPGAFTVLVSVDSEYNDSGYDNSLQAVYVYDKNNMEIPLSMDDREKFTKEVRNAVQIPYETQESMEDIVVRVSQELPSVYIKE